MKEQQITRLMYALILIGALLVATGIGLVVFTDIVTKAGVKGISIIAALIAGGLFLSIPAKIYLTLQLMKYNDAKLRAAQTNDKIS